MPQLTNILEKRKKTKFVKKKYRPWDLSGAEESEESLVGDVAPQESEETQSLELEQNTSPEPILEETTPANVFLPTIPQPKQLDINKSSNVEHLQPLTDTLSDSYSNTIDIKKISNKDINRVHIDTNIDNVIGINLSEDEAKGHIKGLSGIQQKIFFYLVELCNVKGELETGNVPTSCISSVAGCTYGTTKISLKRLIDKGLIIRRSGRRARGGYISFAISKTVKVLAMQIKNEKGMFASIHQQAAARIQELDISLDINLGNKLDIKEPLYSNNKNIIIDLPPEWKSIDFQALTEIGFTEANLKQIYHGGKNSPEVVQRSLDHFGFAIEREARREEIKTKYKGLLNAIMAVLMRGGFWNEIGYQSPEERAFQSYLEEEKKRKSGLKTMVSELLAMRYPAWSMSLTNDEKSQIVPKDILVRNIPREVELHLRTHFVKKTLAELKQNGLLTEHDQFSINELASAL